MSQLIINVGAAPNDGTGDKPRPAFTKVNDNFTELYTALPSPGYISGRWYPCYPQAIGNASAAGTGNALIKYTPAIIHRPVTISALMVRCTAYTAGNVQMAMYAADANLRPTGAVLANTASLTPAGVGLVSGTFAAGSGSNVTITTPGLYFFAINVNQNSTQFMSSNNNTSENSYYLGSTTDTTVSASNSLSQMWLSTVQTYGTWPTNPSITEGSSAAWAFFWFQVA